MKIIKHNSKKKLTSISKLKGNSEIRDRIRVIVYGMEGHTGAWIGERLGYTERWVTKWVKRYNDFGVEGLKDLPRSGQPTKLTPEQASWLISRLEGGPLKGDDINVFRGKDIAQLIESQFGVTYTLQGVYTLLNRLGYSYIKPRPVHPQNNPDEMKLWLKKNDAKISSSNEEKI